MRLTPEAERFSSLIHAHHGQETHTGVGKELTGVFVVSPHCVLFIEHIARMSPYVRDNGDKRADCSHGGA